MTPCQPSALARAFAIVALAALAAASGCSLTRPAPVMETYLLEPALPAPVAHTQAGSLRVGSVNVAAAYRLRSFVVRESDLKFESDFYHEFFVPPAVMIADATARALAVAKVFTHVARPGASVDADWILEGFVGALYADARDAAKPLAVIQVTYYLSRDNGGADAPVWSKAYRRQVPFVPGTLSYVNALNAGLSEILAELATDLAAAELPAR